MRFAAALAVVALPVAVVLALAANGGNLHLLPCAGLPGRAVPIVRDHRHIPYVGAAHARYDSVPATSGPHVPFVVAPGPYRDSIADEVAVHDLEHGHVVVRYAPSLGSAARDRIERFTRRYPRDVVTAPDQRLRAGVVLTAWGRIERLARIDERRIDRFVRALRSRYDHGWRPGAGPCPPPASSR